MKIGIISTYLPSPGGVSTYTGYLFSELKKVNADTVVLADMAISAPVVEGVHRVWKKGNPRLFFQLYWAVKKNHLSLVHVQHELHLFGHKIFSYGIPLLLMALRWRGVKTVTTIHGVVSRTDVRRSFIAENGLAGPVWLYRFLFVVLYRCLAATSDKVIVHDENLKSYLADYGIDEKKITVIPHGIISVPVANNEKKSKTTFLVFGYLTKYKGIEQVAEALKKIPDADIALTVVAAPHPRLSGSSSYQAYYRSIQELFSSDARCTFSGYCPEERLSELFAAADYAIFPYTIHMAQSGPLALALGHNVTPLASQVFRHFLPDGLLFDSADGLAEKIKQAQAGLLESAKQSLEARKASLRWNVVAKNLHEIYERI